MTYTSSLPAYVQKLSPASTEKWQTIFDIAQTRTGSEESAMIVANSWLQRHMSSCAVARSKKVRDIVRFTVDTTAPEFIKRTDSGEEYLVAVLQDVYGDSDGMRWSPEILQEFADQVNSGAQVIGDIDHAEYDEILSSACTEEEVLARFSQKKGIARAVQAVVENGKLWIKALIDKRYKKMLQERARGLSLEAVVTKDDEGKAMKGKLLGWTFSVNESPANPRTAIVA